jgi:Mg chelatase-like protein
MSLALVHSRARHGVAAPAVQVEVHLSGGLPGMSIVGLPEAAVRESKDRVRAALLCAQFEMPQRRITVNLAPADLPKDGGRFDLPIALGILAASGQLPRAALEGREFLGELALTGSLRGVDGALPAILAAARDARGVVLPQANAVDAQVSGHGGACVAGSLLEVCAFLRGETELHPPPLDAGAVHASTGPDLSEVRGQAAARRALEVAASGAHHLLFIGPPGSGKTMLAARLPSILPPLSQEDALQCAAVASSSGARHRSGTLARTQLSRPASHRQWRGPGRRRLAAAAGRDLARTLRHPLSRRTSRMGSCRARRAARALGVGPDHGVARRAPGRVSGALPTRGRDESLPVHGRHGRAREPDET